MGASVEGIVGLISCLLCAVPFMIIARFDKKRISLLPPETVDRH